MTQDTDTRPQRALNHSVMVSFETHTTLSEIRIAMQRAAGRRITMGEVMDELVQCWKDHL